MTAHPPYRLVIFDFDGTLADSLPWLAGALDGAAARFGFRRVLPGEIETLRRGDARAVLRHLGIPAWQLPRVARHLRALATAEPGGMPLFPGVPEMLRALASGGVRLAVVSSNAEEVVRRALGPEAPLVAHYGCGASLFGKAAHLARVVRASGLPREAVLCVGDELRDTEAARAADLAFAAVAWGYTRAETLAAARPALTFAAVGEIAARLGPVTPS